jgi:hypothetical protein
MSESPSPPEVNRGGRRFALSDGPDDTPPPPPVADRDLPDAPPLVLDGLHSPSIRTVNDNGSDPEENSQNEEDEWLPPPEGTHRRDSGEEGDTRRKSRQSRPKVQDDLGADASSHPADGKAPTKSSKAAASAIVQHNLFLSQDEALDEPVVVPNRKAQVEALGDDADGTGRAYVPDVGEAGTVKKKKR